MIKRPLFFHTGYIVSWCLGALAVTSVLLYASQLRHNANQRSNMASEVRMKIDQQFMFIRSTLSDCARQTAQGVGDDPLLPNLPGRYTPINRHFPHMPLTVSGSMALADTVCPNQDNGSSGAPKLFRQNKLTPGPGFLAWQYRNHSSGPLGPAQLSVSIAAQSDNSAAQNALKSLYQRHQTQTGSVQVWQLRTEQDQSLSLLMILAGSP